MTLVAVHLDLGRLDGAIHPQTPLSIVILNREAGPARKQASGDVRDQYPRRHFHDEPSSGCTANTYSATGTPPIRCSWMMRSTTAGVTE